MQCAATYKDCHICKTKVLVLTELLMVHGSVDHLQEFQNPIYQKIANNFLKVPFIKKSPNRILSLGDFLYINALNNFEEVNYFSKY